MRRVSYANARCRRRFCRREVKYDLQVRQENPGNAGAKQWLMIAC